MRPLRWCAALATALATLCAPPARATVPAGLPLHFSIGVTAAPDANGLDGWVPDSGVPFDYVYQYLAGGVNTSDTWRNWNDNATFPLNYARSAAARHAIPVFPYYELLQSAGPCDSCGEAEKDLAHLASPSVMRAYYSDVRTLMQRLGPGTYGSVAGFGKTAIVHVEPDLSGYAEQAVLDPASNCYGHCTGTGNDPSLLRASVASSGFADVSGYANTFAGFAQAIAHLRDRYAPNVLLAFHVSNWAPLHDVGSEHQALDAVALGKLAGTFARLAGRGYQLLFNDVADRDAGYYKTVNGSDVWWDKLNVAVPNFRRWEQFVSAVSNVAARPVIVWQIPLGNQYFETENNTWNHYQDNRAEYFFGHVAELRANGIIALLFGRGNDGSSANYDANGDGVTNPASSCSTDGVSSGSVCNSHASTVADDDGGYLRMAAASYYQHVASLLYLARVSASPASFRHGGSTRIAFSISIPARVTVTIRDAANKIVKVLASNSSMSAGAHSVVWSSGSARAGRYRAAISASIGPAAPAAGSVPLTLT
jgi:hypothetical protein